MPIYKICNRCNKKLPSGSRCECEKKRHREYDKYNREKKYTDFYHSKDGEIVREKAIVQCDGLDLYNELIQYANDCIAYDHYDSREQIYCKNVIYEYNPLLNYAISNTVIKTNNGLIKIDKDATKKRIDPIDTMLCAFKLAIYHEFVDWQSTEDWLDSDE